MPAAEGGSALRDAVARAAEGTPYRIVDTDKGFDLELDVANARWWDLFGSAGLKRAFRWKVTEKKSSYTITDEDRVMTWRAGQPGLGGSYSKQKGRIFSFTRANIWAVGDSGRIEHVVNYKFNSREGRDLIRLAARQLGLKERMPWAIKGTFIILAAIAVLVGIFDIWFLSDSTPPNDCGTVNALIANNTTFDERAAASEPSPTQYRDHAADLKRYASMLSDPTLRDKANSLARLADRDATLKIQRTPQSLSEIPNIQAQFNSTLAELATACTAATPASGTGAAR